MAAPINTAPPVITVTNPVAGNAMTVSNGTWSNSPTSYTYRWQEVLYWLRDDFTWYACPYMDLEYPNLITTQSYPNAGGTFDSAIMCTVTATNADGSTSAASALRKRHSYNFTPAVQGGPGFLSYSFTQLRITFQDFIDPFTIPPASSFVVANHTISNVYFDTKKSLLLTFGEAFTSGEASTLSYTAGANSIRDMNGKVLPNITNLAFSHG